LAGLTLASQPCLGRPAKNPGRVLGPSRAMISSDLVHTMQLAPGRRAMKCSCASRKSTGRAEVAQPLLCEMLNYSSKHIFNPYIFCVIFYSKLPQKGRVFFGFLSCGAPRCWESFIFYLVWRARQDPSAASLSFYLKFIVQPKSESFKRWHDPSQGFFLAQLILVR
jgi:hypothetical protein